MIDGSGVELTPGELQDDLRTVVDSRVEHRHLELSGRNHPGMAMSHMAHVVNPVQIRLPVFSIKILAPAPDNL